MLNCFVFERCFPIELELKYVQISFRKREIEGSCNLKINFGQRVALPPGPPPPIRALPLDPNGGLGGPQTPGPMNLNFHQYSCSSYIKPLFICIIYHSPFADSRWAVVRYWQKLDTMSFCEIGPQSNLPINITKGSMPLQYNTYFPRILPI